MNTTFSLERKSTPEGALIAINHKIQSMQAKNPELTDDLTLKYQNLNDSYDEKVKQVESLSDYINRIASEIEETEKKVKSSSSSHEIERYNREMMDKNDVLQKKLASTEKIQRELEEISDSINKYDTQEYREFIQLLAKRENLEKILYPDKKTTQSASYSARKFAEDSPTRNRDSCKLNLLPYIADMINTAWSKELCNKYKINIDATKKNEKIEFNFQNFKGSIEVTEYEVTLSKEIPIAERARAVDAMIEIFIQGILKDKNIIFHDAYSADVSFKDLLEFKLAFQLKHVHGLAYHVVNGKSLDQILNKTAESDKQESPKKVAKSKSNISEQQPEQVNRLKPNSG